MSVEGLIDLVQRHVIDLIFAVLAIICFGLGLFLLVAKKKLARRHR
jgi:hypothetical protein